MTTRFLSPEEWGKLDGVALDGLLKFCAPENVAVVVVEDGDEIIGCMAVLQITHLEGVWVRPDKRRGIVLRPLLRQAMALARVRNESWVLGGAEDSDFLMDGLIKRMGGQPLPIKFYPMPTGGH